jgi:hypothetical protein
MSSIGIFLSIGLCSGAIARMSLLIIAERRKIDALLAQIRQSRLP